MRKGGHINLTLALALLLLSGILILVVRGPVALDSEKTFMAELHSSLYHIDQAKWKWAEEKHKPEQAVPTMEDLTPYLGDWSNRIQQLRALGIDYKLTPFSEMQPQSDIATLTRAIRRGDGDTLFEHFTRTRAIRRGILAVGQDSPAPDFGRQHAGLPTSSQTTSSV